MIHNLFSTEIVASAGGEFSPSYKNQITNIRKILVIDKQRKDLALSQEIIKKYPTISVITDDAFLNCILKQKLDI